jgi:hypothetical protein
MPPLTIGFTQMTLKCLGRQHASVGLSLLQIEDVQQSQVGWLFSRGAFDKTDLLYLRDEDEKRRHLDVELRDSEKARFQLLRSKSTDAQIAVGVGVPRVQPKKAARWDVQISPSLRSCE